MAFSGAVDGGAAGNETKGVNFLVDFALEILHPMRTHLF